VEGGFGEEGGVNVARVAGGALIVIDLHTILFADALTLMPASIKARPKDIIAILAKSVGNASDFSCRVGFRMDQRLP
jgi:hypothetical protein